MEMVTSGTSTVHGGGQFSCWSSTYLAFISQLIMTVGICIYAYLQLH